MKTAELKNVPHEIYLCVEDELQTNDFQELEHEFVTWNDRRTDKSDIKYVLAEHAAQQTAALREELRLMTEDRNRASIAWGLEYGNTLQLKDQVNQLRSELDKAREENRKLSLILECIGNISEDQGHSGCTYGDTEYDSLSAVYGYNLCLSQVKDILKTGRGEEG